MCKHEEAVLWSGQRDAARREKKTENDNAERETKGKWNGAAR